MARKLEAHFPVKPVYREEENLSLFALVRALSVDVSLGALCGGVLAVHALKVHMPVVWWFVLPACVWLVYTLDHLLDAHRIGPNAHTVRHRFHYRYKKRLSIAAFIVAVPTGIAALWGLSTACVLLGLGMAFLSGLHIMLVRKVGAAVSPFLTKEAAVAVVYTLGIWGCPVLEASQAMVDAAYIWIPAFIALALANLLLFAMYEFAIDESDGHTSFVRAVGLKRARIVVACLCCFVPLWSIAGGGFLGQAEFAGVAIIFTIMSAVLCLLLLFPAYFVHNERYRIIGDAAFFLPVLTLLL